MSMLPESVTITDDTMREGLQIESASIPVDAKLRLHRLRGQPHLAPHDPATRIQPVARVQRLNRIRPVRIRRLQYPTQRRNRTPGIRTTQRSCGGIQFVVQGIHPLSLCLNPDAPVMHQHRLTCQPLSIYIPSARFL